MVPTHHGFPTTEGEPESAGDWLQKNIAVVTLIIAIFVQTVGIAWWASGVSSANNSLAEVNSRQNAALEKLSDLVEQNAERLTKVQTIQENVVKILDQISHRQSYPQYNDGPPRGP